MISRFKEPVVSNESRGFIYTFAVSLDHRSAWDDLGVQMDQVVKEFPDLRLLELYFADEVYSSHGTSEDGSMDGSFGPRFIRTGIVMNSRERDQSPEVQNAVLKILTTKIIKVPSAPGLSEAATVGSIRNELKLLYSHCYVE